MKHYTHRVGQHTYVFSVWCMCKTAHKYLPNSKLSIQYAQEPTCHIFFPLLLSLSSFVFLAQSFFSLTHTVTQATGVTEPSRLRQGSETVCQPALLLLY